MDSRIPYVILCPGGLSNDIRDDSITNLQVDPSGALPFPCRIGRDDVAALCVAAIVDTPDILPANKSYTLACRWVGAVGTKSQGTKQAGFASASECMKNLVESNPDPAEYPEMKPYRLTMAVTFYCFAFVLLKVILGLWTTTKKLVLPYL